MNKLSNEKNTFKNIESFPKIKNAKKALIEIINICNDRQKYLIFSEIKEYRYRLTLDYADRAKNGEILFIIKNDNIEAKILGKDYLTISKDDPIYDTIMKSYRMIMIYSNGRVCSPDEVQELSQSVLLNNYIKKDITKIKFYLIKKFALDGIKTLKK
jgi:hypothetical protein